MSKIKPSERAANFIGKLCRVQNDRGKMAALRRGLSSATVMDAWPVVAGLGGSIGKVGESVYVDIAALFALHSDLSNARNFGETCRVIAFAHSSDKKLPESYERRFRRLIASSEPTHLVEQLRSWIRFAAGKGVGVNYESLFADLWNWGWYAEDIRVRWAQSFWCAGSGIEDPATLETTTLPATV